MQQISISILITSEEYLHMNKNFLKTAAPSSFELLAYQLLHMVDIALAAMVGTNAIVAISAMTALSTLLIVAPHTLANANNIITARLSGQGEKEEAEQQTKYSVYIGFLSITIPLVLILIFLKQVLGIYGLKDEANTFAMQYFMIRWISAPCGCMADIICAYERSINRAKKALNTRIYAGLINLVLSSLLVYFGYGVIGLAIGTVISEIYQIIACLIRNPFLLKFERLQFSKLKETTSLWRSLIAETLSTQIGNNICIALIARIGVVPYATYTICYQIYELFGALAYGIGNGSTVCISRQVGANETHDELKQTVKYTYQSAFVLGLICTVVIMLFRVPLASFLSKDKEVLDLCVTTLLWMTWCCTITPFLTFAIRGTLRGAKDLRALTITNQICGIIIRPLLTALFISLSWGLTGVFIAYSLDLTIRLLYFSSRIKRGIWLNKCQSI